MARNLDSNGRPVFADGDAVAYNGRENPRFVSGVVVGDPVNGETQVQLDEIDGGALITANVSKLIHMGHIVPA